ncbi:MAG: sodium-dependent transporter, partial [Gammaproteobacteria bacterium]
MLKQTNNDRLWSSRLAFSFAIVSASIGLGNLWRFPYVAGENGGGAFILVYLGIILIVCIPLIMAELAMGRRGGGSPVTSLANLIREGRQHRFWVAIGWLSILTPLGALTFYAVVAGWSLDYIYHALQGTFFVISAPRAEAQFADLLASPGRLMFWHALYLAATVYVIGKGVKKGIERVTGFIMPALFGMIVLLVIYGCVEGAPGIAWRFMFYPDFSGLSWHSVLMALGQALFSVTVGTGALLTYGAYLSRDMGIVGPAWAIAISDTLAALLAGMAIFSIVFASGLDPASGPGLMFETLPLALGNMPGGHFFST